MVEPLAGRRVRRAGRRDLAPRRLASASSSGLREHGGLLAAARCCRVTTSRLSRRSTRVRTAIVGGVGRLPSSSRATSCELRRDASDAEAMVRAGHRDDRRLAGWSSGRRRAAHASTAATPSSSRRRHAPLPAAQATLRPRPPCELRSIEYASVAIVTVAFDAAGSTPSSRASGFLVPPVDGRAIKAATYSSQQVGVAGGRGRDGPVQRRPVAARKPSCSATTASSSRPPRLDLRDAVGPRCTARRASRDALGWRAAAVRRRPPRAGSSASGHAVAASPGLAVCGAAYDGVGIPAVIASAQAAATRVIADLGSAETMGA